LIYFVYSVAAAFIIVFLTRVIAKDRSSAGTKPSKRSFLRGVLFVCLVSTALMTVLHSITRI
jgi:hypothetical protein